MQYQKKERKGLQETSLYGIPVSHCEYLCFFPRPLVIGMNFGPGTIIASAEGAADSDTAGHSC